MKNNKNEIIKNREIKEKIRPRKNTKKKRKKCEKTKI